MQEILSEFTSLLYPVLAGHLVKGSRGLESNLARLYTPRINWPAIDKKLASKSKESYVKHIDRNISDNPILIAEEVHYGFSGFKGILQSLYIFGAALLAFMGGFSYSYSTTYFSCVQFYNQSHKLI